MVKDGVITSISEKTGLTKKDSELALKALIETIEETVAKDESVNLVGFGKFEPRARAEREGKNPQTQEPLHIEATVVPVFKAGSGFKKIVKDALVK